MRQSNSASVPPNFRQILPLALCLLGFFPGKIAAQSCSVEATLPVTIRPKVSIAAAGPTAICNGQSVALNAAAGFQTYQWLLNGSPLSGATGASFQAAIPGNYSVQASAAGGCTSISATVEVTFKPFAIAQFNYATTNLSVSFSNVSTNANTYSWNFGDGSPASTAANPTHVFPGPGTYIVVLTATGDCNVRTSTQTITVTCPPISVAISAAGSTAICPSQSVVLNATLGFQNYVWQINGVPQPPSNSPNLTVLDPGTYFVVGQASPGCTGSSNAVVVTQKPAAVAAFSVSKNDLAASFSNTSQNATTYSWDFGDPNSGAANSSTAANPTHNFSAAGTFTVVLTATNDCGSQSISQTISATCPTLNVAVSATGNTAICSGESVLLTATAGFQTYLWKRSGMAISGATSASYTATLAGNYRVVVSDATACTGLSQLFAVTEKPLAVPAFSFSVNDLTASFSNTSQNSTTFSWSFGDPNSGAANASTDLNPTHQFSAAGTFTVILTATNDCGPQTISQTVSVACPLLNVAISAAGPTAICPGQSVVLTATSGFQNYQWLLGGQPISGASGASFSANLAGNYAVVATDGTGCSGTSSAVSISEKPLPEPSFLATPNFLSTSFLNTSANATSYSWNFGDPNSGANNAASAANPTHVFSHFGSFTVILTATNDCGSQVFSQTVLANCPPVAVSVLASATAFCPGQSVNLTATSGFQNYQWLLGGQAISGASGASFSANLAGNYSVVVTDDHGCTGVSNSILITEKPLPTAGFSYTTDYLSASFSNTSSNASQFFWLFGFPTQPSYEANPTQQFPASGQYTVFFVAENDCGADTLEQTVQVECLPVPAVSISGLAPVYLDNAAPVTLVGNPPGGTFSGPGIVSGNVFQPALAGLGQVVIHYLFYHASGCQFSVADTTEVKHFVATTVLPGLRAAVVFPNPTAGAFWLRLDLSAAKSLTVRLLNSLGQPLAVRRGDFSAGVSTLFFEKMGLPSGAYFLEISDGFEHGVLPILVGN